jgi:hypothetical protein
MKSAKVRFLLASLLALLLYGAEAYAHETSTVSVDSALVVISK